MKVSVITVCYNSAATIADTLRSVASQSHADIEHIVVDGASSDSTLQIVRDAGPHVARVVSERDRGIYDAMNKGLRLATGELVGFLNADDIYAGPDVVAAIDQAAAQPSVDGVYGDLVYVAAGDPSRVIRRWRSGEFDRSRLRYGWMPPHPTLYVRRDTLAGVDGFDLQFRIAADYDFMLRYLTARERRLAYLPQVMVRMRLGGTSNRSLAAVMRKSREDLAAIRRSGVGGVATLMCKNLRKLPQLVPAG
jgi:glycosyltransferase